MNYPIQGNDINISLMPKCYECDWHSKKVAVRKLSSEIICDDVGGIGNSSHLSPDDDSTHTNFPGGWDDGNGSNDGDDDDAGGGGGSDAGDDSCDATGDVYLVGGVESMMTIFFF